MIVALGSPIRALARRTMENGHVQARDCPDRSELASFITGNLSALAFNRITRHVECCPVCEKALSGLDDHADSLILQLRTSGTPSRAIEEPVPPDLLATAQSCYSKDCPQNADLPLRLGRFELLEELGIGSFGHVFRALDTALGRIVAIKMLRAGRLASKEEVERFVREARSAAQLQHRGLVALYETGQTEEGVFYLVEEFVPGETLAARMKVGNIEFRPTA
jgi:eukaryotic-like serine/threonine-protein kinase